MSADFWAGYLSGAVGIVVGNPLDLLKTRLQAGGNGLVQPTSAAGVRATFESAGALVRGASAPILGYGALNALLFVTYNRSLALFSGNSGNPTYGQVYMAGIVGGLATFVVSAPTELIKVRAQIANSDVARATGVGTQTSSWKITKDTWKREGLRGLYLGGGVTAWRDAIGYGFYFCAYDMSKRLVASPSESIDNLSAWKILIAGGIAGCIGWASIFPLDVIKTRMQAQPVLGAKTPSRVSTALNTPSGTPPRSPIEARQSVPSTSSARSTSYGSISQPSGSPPRSPQSQHSSYSNTQAPRLSTWGITRQTYRSEGLAVFFRGLGICSVRAFIVNAVQWAVYEWCMAILVPKQGHRTDINESLNVA